MTSSDIIKHKSTWRHIVLKLHNINGKEKIFNANKKYRLLANGWNLFSKCSRLTSSKGLWKVIFCTDFYAQPNYHVRMMAIWRFFSDLKDRAFIPQTHAERTLKEYILVRRKSTTEDGMKIIKATMRKLI